MANAVLLVTDIAADRFPTACVRTGERTTSATHLWALASPRADRVLALLGVVGVVALRAVGTKALRVPIPVSPRPYAFWRRRATTWATVTCFGLGLLLVSPVRGGPALGAVGIAVVIVSQALRARAHSGFWVSAELRPVEGHVIIRRAHPAFDAQARALFRGNLER